ncbi:MAG: glycerophosphodiester phosphodiesterase [Verrucomicrobiae bacterium]|nr:glycerophosphodiester phosphodiesterase [Verrucomicrobiae bacterium]
MRNLLTVLIAVAWLSPAAVSHAQAAARHKMIIAHRGASGYLPEHTLPAKAMAYAMGADFLEQDVVLSKDGIPMVLHDHQLDAVTDVATRFPGRQRADQRFYVIDFTLAELKTLRVTERFHVRHNFGQPVYPKRFPMGKSSFQISTLEEELQMIQGLNQSTGRDVGLSVEIKRPAWHRKQGQDISTGVLEVLARYGYKNKNDHFHLQCFEFPEIKRIRNELGFQGAIFQCLGDKVAADGTDHEFLKTAEGLAELAKFADGIAPAVKHVVTGDKESGLKFSNLIKLAHERGLKVFPYTCRADELPPCAATLEELFDLLLIRADADGVFTDFPDRGAAFVRSHEEAKHP